MTRSPAQIELDDIHDAVAGIPCDRCGAPIGARCFNPITGRASRIPCLARIQRLAGDPDAT
ncbi:MAG: zinc finger domain-containing protein [Pseudonocardiaceae bacterium]